MPIGKTEEWSHAGHSLRIDSWYPRSEMAITPSWYQGFVDGVLVVEGCYKEKVRTRLKIKVTRDLNPEDVTTFPKCKKRFQ